MRVDRVILDQRKSLSQILEALDNNLTARHNLAPEGESGWVLTSRGPNQVPAYQPVTLSGDVQVDWGQITNTPNTLHGYGIEDAYTIAEVDNLIDTHTHDAADIISGILTTPRLGSGVAGPGTYLRGDSTWQPLSLAGLGIASEVAGVAAAAAALEVGNIPEPEIVPGPRGADGAPGAAGPPGVGTLIQMHTDEMYEENYTVPGPTGTAGAPGTVGATGPTGALIQLIAEEHYDEFITTPGPAGNLGPTGSQGPIGSFQLIEEYYNDEYTVPGPIGPAGPAGPAGAGGSGGASYLMFDLGETPDQEDRLALSRKVYNNITETNAGIIVSGGVVSILAGDAINEGGEISLVGAGAFTTWNFDNFQGRLRWFTAGGTQYMDFNAAGKMLLMAGGFLEINQGPDTTSGIFHRAAADNFQIRTNDNGAGVQQDATKPSWAFVFGEGVTDNFAIYRKAPAGAYVALWQLNNNGHWKPYSLDNGLDIGIPTVRCRTVHTVEVSSGALATASMVKDEGGGIIGFGKGSGFTQLNLYQGGTARWHVVSGGHFYPVATNTYDIGSAALSVKDVWVDGEVVGENGSNCSTAAQAAIGTALTDLTGTTWAVGTNETWEFEVFVQYSRNATAGSVNFAINGPAAMTTAFQVFGSTTSAAAYSASVLQNLVNTGTPGTTTFGSGISVTTYFAVIRGRLTTAGTAGTAAARAITVGAGSTMTPGYAHVTARRIS